MATADWLVPLHQNKLYLAAYSFHGIYLDRVAR